MPILRFSDWTPDAAEYGSPGMTVATNVLPGRESYKPVPDLSVVSGALDSRPLGAIEARDADNEDHVYAGDAAKLYELDVELKWEDKSKSGGYSTADGESWEFVRWGNNILATNFSDNPQQITMGSGIFSDLTTDFRARHIAVVRDFVVAGNTWDSSDGNVANRLRWSAIGDETDWTVSSVTLSDFRDLTTGGPILKILGGDVGIIISDRAVFRMNYVGVPVVFQIDEVLPEIGAISSGSVARIGDTVYFASEQGFVELTGGGTGVNYIGAGKVDKFFAEDRDPDFLDRMSAVVDPTSNRVAWLYVKKGSTTGTPDRIIIYDRTYGKWSLIEQDATLLLRSKAIAITLDELPSLGYTNLDTMEPSLDSDIFKGASLNLAAIDDSFKLGFFRAKKKTATLTTQEVELHSGRVSHCNAFRPLVDGGTVKGRVGTRDRQTDSVEYSKSLTQSRSGRYTTRARGRYHRFELTVTGDDWTDGIGVDIQIGDAKRGGRRG